LLEGIPHRWRLSTHSLTHDDDDLRPVWTTWAVGALSGVRDVFTSIVYVFTYPRTHIWAYRERAVARELKIDRTS
jgi:hypothetical protein